jgi:hypothetical protein
MTERRDQIKDSATSASYVGRPLDNSAVEMDDVVQAYRWILGRDPESNAKAEELARTPRLGRAELRLRFLRSQEFLKQITRYGLAIPFSAHAAELRRILPDQIPRLVFLHIPKTGGTTLHQLLVDSLDGETMCPERHNCLGRRSAVELASYRLFSGHYDRSALLLIPGSHRRVVTLLRNPRARLISLYRYLRAHSEKRASIEDMELAAAARLHDLAGFLQAACSINIASVDNTYLRAFGAFLPSARWERRAESGSNVKLKELGSSPESLLQTALQFIDGLSAVGILEEFDVSLRAIGDAFRVPLSSQYSVLQRTDSLVSDAGAFDAAEPAEVTAEAEALIEKLTRFDNIIYAHGVELVNRRQSSPDPGLRE